MNEKIDRYQPHFLLFRAEREKIYFDQSGGWQLEHPLVRILKIPSISETELRNYSKEDPGPVPSEEFPERNRKQSLSGTL
jgi:hypothetical protein